MQQPPQHIGPYEIVAPLGAGGMGRVYRAHDSRLNRDVAVKLLPPEFSSDPLRRARFEQEARAVAALNHPGIVSVYDVGDGWMVTELVEGDNLRAVDLGLAEAIDAGAQMAEALAAAHEAGITHRDLKPENVILTPDGRTKILDFGLAKVRDVADESRPAGDRSTITNPGTPAGTPGYMAPEQVRGLQSDHRADIFSLGIILYELLSKKQAFGGESSVDSMHAIVHDQPTELPAHMPVGLRRIVKRCLEKKPANRFQSARDLAFALRSLSGSVEKATPTRRRDVRWLWVAGIAAAAGIAAIVYGLVTRQSVPDIGQYVFHPFAYTAAAEHTGVWSPDGQTVAFLEQDGQGGTRLLVQSLDAVAPTQLAVQASQPVWSKPDGERLYFLAFNGIFAVSRAGGQPERILTGATAFDVAPNGQAFAIWRGSAAENGETGNRYSVWISSPLGDAPKEYAPAPFATRTPFTPVYVRFSPDGSKIYLSLVTDAGAETWLLPYPAGSGEPRRIFADIPWNRPVAASWMPDSRRMVLSGNAAPTTGEQLWMADTEAQTLTRLTALPEGGQATPALSPDGKRLLFTQVRRDRNIMELPLDGAEPRTLLATSLSEFGPAWSPKGDQFAYITRRNGTDELWVRGADGNFDRPVVTAREFPTLETIIGPEFSPDGTRIAYTALLAGGGRRRSMAISPVTGGTPAVIADGYAPTWSPDGSRIAFLWLKPDGTIPVATLRVGSDDPPIEILPPVPGWSAPEWSPQGDFIAVPNPRGVELVSPDGKTRRTISGNGQGFGTAIAWSRDAKTIYGLTFQSPRPALSAADVASGAIRRIAEYSIAFLPLLENSYTGTVRLSMAPDGKSVAVASANSQSDLWILDGFEK